MLLKSNQIKLIIDELIAQIKSNKFDLTVILLFSNNLNNPYIKAVFIGNPFTRAGRARTLTVKRRRHNIFGSTGN